MALVTITANPVTLQKFQLLVYSDMMTALQYLATLTASPYTGLVQVTNPGGNGTLVWSMNLYNTHQNTSQTAYINDYVILQNNTTATICPAAQYASLYTG
jgi:hypothetical protein